MAFLFEGGGGLIQRNILTVGGGGFLFSLSSFFARGVIGIWCILGKGMN